ncbi:MAG: DNA polymerase ligase N-terminal domain-containing protein [Fervidobacterium sp.]
MPRYVVHEHHAKRAGLHYDFRLEEGGVLKSWVCRKSPPTEEGVTVLAVQVEDHPLSFINFEGRISIGYGAGQVKIWDKGEYEMLHDEGNVKLFRLYGERLNGLYSLVNFEKNKWFLTKEEDAKKINKREGIKRLMKTEEDAIEVIEKIIEQLEKITCNPDNPYTFVEKKFGIQRGYFEQEPEFPPPEDVEQIEEEVEKDRTFTPEVVTTQPLPPEEKKPFMDVSEAYSFGLTFEDKINRSKYTIPSSLKELSQIEAEALLRNKMFDFLESIGALADDISVTFEPEQFAIRVILEGTAIDLFFFDVNNTWRLINAEVKML